MMFEGGSLRCERVQLADTTLMRTGKPGSNAAVDDGGYPFFVSSQQTLAAMIKGDFEGLGV